MLTPLQAAREKNGIFFSSASWAELAAEQEARRLALEESKKLLEINEAQLESSRDQFEQSMRLLGTREEELKRVGVELEGKRSEVRGLLEEVEKGQKALEEEGWLREAFERSRSGWKGTAGEAMGDVDGLRAKLGGLLSLLATSVELTFAFDYSSQNFGREGQSHHHHQRRYRLHLDDGRAHSAACCLQGDPG